MKLVAVTIVLTIDVCYNSPARYDLHAMQCCVRLIELKDHYGGLPASCHLELNI